MKPGSVRDALPWLLGFGLVANAYLAPGAAGSPRVTDACGLALAVWMVGRLVGRGLPGARLAAVGLLALPVAGWTAVAAFSGLKGTLLLGARWLLAVPWGLALAELAATRADRRRLAWGLWWGLAANVAVLLAQNAGLLDATTRLGLAARDSVLGDLDQFWRYPGMHGHANASSAVVSLIVPVSFYLCLGERAPLWVPIAGTLLLLSAGHITMSRSPLIVATVVAAALGVAARRPLAVLKAGAALLVIVVPALLWFGPPGGQIRWEDQGNVAVNSAGRLESNLIGAALVGDRPLGRGVEASAEALEDALDNPSMHNGYLHLAAVFGIPLAAWVGLALLRCAARLPAGTGNPGWLAGGLALQTIGLFFFEQHAGVPTFAILCTWLVAAAAPGDRAETAGP